MVSDYDKSVAGFFEVTFPFLLEAKKNAIMLINSRSAVDGGPYTDIDLLIDELLKLIPEAFFAKSNHIDMVAEYKKTYFS